MQLMNNANLNRDQAEFEFVCGPCQHDLQPRHDTEFISEDLPGQFPILIQ